MHSQFMYYNATVHLLYAYHLLLCTQFLLAYTGSREFAHTGS